MSRLNLKRLTILALLSTCAIFAQAKLKDIKPGWNLFSKDQDVQMGREAAAEIEKTVTLAPNGPLVDYISELGRKIAQQPQAGGYPYTFKVVNDPGINAFALPGGPVYINSGILKNAENEAQLVGVMAHEISHVSLRHSTNQLTKSYAIQIPAMIAGVYGQSKGGMTGMLAQLGVGLGANSVLLKFSRSAEQQADLLGARMMSQMGYNPLEMARFFEKLEAASGGKGGSQFFASHPNPGNRVKYVQEEITLLPRRDYTNDQTGRFPKMKDLANSLPAPKKRAAAQGESGLPAQPPANSDGTRTWPGADFRATYPGNWVGLGEQKSPSITLAPKEGLKQGSNGQLQIGVGVIVSHLDTSDNGSQNFQQDSENLINQIMQQNNIRGERPQMTRGTLRGLQTLTARVYSQSPLGGKEVDTIITIQRPKEITYVVLIAPESEQNNLEPVFRNILNSLQFTD